MKDSNAEVQNVTLGNTVKKETWQKIQNEETELLDFTDLRL